MSDILCSKCDKGHLRKLETPIKTDVFFCDKCGNIQIWGPCCDQGWIRYMRIKGKESTIFICEECDTIWESICNIGTESRKAYSKYAEENSLVDTWDILEELPITKSLLDRIGNTNPKT